MQENTTGVEVWQTVPEVIQATKLSAANMAAVARWCGGKVTQTQSSIQGMSGWPVLVIPTLMGNQTVEIDGYVVRNLETGEFRTEKQETFEDGRYIRQTPPIEDETDAEVPEDNGDIGEEEDHFDPDGGHPGEEIIDHPGEETDGDAEVPTEAG